MASNFLPALRDAVADRICPLANSLEYINDSYRRAVGVPFIQNPLVTLGGAVSRLFCDQPPPPLPPPPFNGGQCPGVLYRMLVSAVQNGTVINNTSAQGLGPVQGLRLERVPDPSPVNPDFVRLDAYAVFADSETSVGSYDASNTTVNIVGIQRLDGQTDGCGDPPPVIEPPDINITNYDFDLTYNDISGNQVIIPIVLAFGFLQINANGTVAIPFKVDVNGDFQLNGTANFDGQINFGIVLPGGTIDTDIRIDNCRDIVLPDDEVPEDPTDSEQPERPDRSEEKVIKGALVTSTAISLIRSSVIGQDENPDIYAPSLGHINFLCRVGTTTGGWTVDLPVKNRRCLIPCPWPDGALAVRGTPQPGVTWEITPIYGRRESPVQYPYPISQ